jgi:Putative zinc-finger
MNGRIIKFEGSVHAESDRILPWLVNGTLTGDERLQVEQHLVECEQCQREVAWLRTIQDEYNEDRSVNDEWSTPTMRRLHRRMGTEHTVSMASPARPSAWRHRGRRLYWLAAAQTVLILVLGVALFQERQVSYHTLSAPEDKGYLFAVAFDPRISEDQLRQLVRASDARIVGGPTETGAYLLRVPSERATAARTMLRSSARVTKVEDLEAGASR